VVRRRRRGSKVIRGGEGKRNERKDKQLFAICGD